MSYLGLPEQLVARIDPIDLRGYAVASGWIRLEGVSGRVAIYNHPASDLDQLLIPNDAGSPDYVRRMAEVVANLAEREGRPAWEVLNDLLHPRSTRQPDGGRYPPAPESEDDSLAGLTSPPSSSSIGGQPMGSMGDGYGSECHLLRWMGRHRRLFDQQVAAAIGKPDLRLEWEDFPFDAKKSWPDAEWKGLDFLKKTTGVPEAWPDYWPTGSGIMNWDAVGWIGEGESRELLLVEAKAHIGEIRSNCKAEDPRSIAKIDQAFTLTKAALKVGDDRDWKEGYYQFTNRLAVLHFLNDMAGIPTRLVLIYFVGDLRNASRQSPQNIAEWKTAINEQNEHVGFTPGPPLADRVHSLFLPVAGPGSLPGF